MVLQRKLSGQTTFTNIGSDKTNSNGAWSVNTTPKNGAVYHGFVTKRNVSGNTCKGNVSKNLTARQAMSSIAINVAGNAFKGKVSATSACVPGRTVHLQRKSPGQSNFSNVGSADTTDSTGAWIVATNPVNGAQYRAKVNAKTAGANACMATTSSVTTARPTNLTIAQGGSTNFHGNVNATAACEPNRTVTLQRKTIYETTFHGIGSDASSSTGFWRVNTAVVSGASYRATVGAKQVGANSCLDDISKVIVAS